MCSSLSRFSEPISNLLPKSRVPKFTDGCSIDLIRVLNLDSDSQLYRRICAVRDLTGSSSGRMPLVGVSSFLIALSSILQSISYQSEMARACYILGNSVIIGGGSFAAGDSARATPISPHAAVPCDSQSGWWLNQMGKPVPIRNKSTRQPSLRPAS